MTRTRPRVGPLASTGVSAPALDVDALLDDPGTGIIVCCGSGGRRQDHHVRRPGAAGGRAGPQGRGADHRPGPAPRAVDGDRGARQHPAPGGQGPGGQGRQPRRDDAGHEAHLRRGRRERRQPGEGPADPGEPLLHRAVQLVRGHPGVHGHGEARPAPPAGAGGRVLRPDRGRHPAVALGAGLPGRPRAALELPRRAVHPVAARPGQGSGTVHDRGAGGDHRGAEQDPRGAVPAGHADLRRRPGHAVRRLPGPRRGDLRAAPGRRDRVPRHRRARAGRAARGGVLRRAAERGPDAAGGARGQPRQPAARDGR